MLYNDDAKLFNLMHERGMGFHANHRVTRGRQLVGWLYTCDTVSDEDMDAIKQLIPSAERWKSQMQYAPEIVKACVFVPSKAELKRRLG